MKDILDQLKKLTIIDPFSNSQIRNFESIQINYDVNVQKICVQVGYENGITCRGNSGQNLICAILNSIKDARDRGYKVVGSHTGDFAP